MSDERMERDPELGLWLARMEREPDPARLGRVHAHIMRATVARTERWSDQVTRAWRYVIPLAGAASIAALALLARGAANRQEASGVTTGEPVVVLVEALRRDDGSDYLVDLAAPAWGSSASEVGVTR